MNKRKIKGKFTLICNNCGEKTEITQDIMDIRQNGKVNINIDYRYQILEIKCNNCGQLITDEPLEIDFER